MTQNKACLNLIRTNLKRMVKYLPHVLIAVLLLLALSGAAGIYMSKNLYQEEQFQSIKIAYFLPPDGEQDLMGMGVDLVMNLEGMKEAAEFIELSSREEGFDLLEKGEILYLILVPDTFFSDVMYGYNTPLEIVLRDKSTVASYVANELFISYAACLAIAQAAVYSVIDTAHAHDFSDDWRHGMVNLVNTVTLERFLNKYNYLERQEATGDGNYSLLEHYLALAVLLTLCFSAFILIPLLQGCGRGVEECLKLYGLNRFHIWLSDFVCTVVCLMVAFIPCWIAVSVYQKQFHAWGIIQVVPAILLVALLISVSAVLCKNAFSANMVILFAVLFFAYIGGGLFPTAMLPRLIAKIGAYMPGHAALSWVARALFI